MKQKLIRAGLVTVLVIAVGIFGYNLGKGSSQATNVSIPTQAISAQKPGTIRVIYSLDKKQNDKEIIALINSAKHYIYFAMYEFTLKDIAEALVSAKKRGIDVRGLVDSGESAKSYDKPVIAIMLNAGIPIETERHASGNGIMHIKAIVTDSAYAIGSYNWTHSATTVNDEILEVGTDPSLRQAYENILKRLFNSYKGTTADAKASAPISIGTITTNNAHLYIGKTASVRGTLFKAYAANSGTVFLDFCKNYKTCSFSGVIFSGDISAFGDLSRYVDKTITLTGEISSYQGKAEIILSSPSQLSLGRPTSK